MTDAVPEIPAPAPVEGASAPATPPEAPKKRRLFRWWGIICLLVVAVLLLVVLPFVVQPWVLGKIRNGLAANGWELTPESQLSFSLYGATLHGEKLELRMIQKGADGSQAQVATADRLHAEFAVFESLTKSDVVIQELAVEGMTGNLRRGPDGRIQTLPPEKEDEKSGPGTDWSKVDWAGWYEKAMEKYRQRQAEQEQAKQQEPKPGEPAKQPEPVPESARPAPEPDIEWPKASKVQPLPKAGRHVPRVVVRKLAISGKAVKLPDESPFEVAKFSITGDNVSLRQDAGETMDLKGQATTTGAGDITLDLLRKPDDTGSLKIAAPAVPVEALSHPAIAGASIGKYGASGVANVVIDNAWTGWDLTGLVQAKVTGLEMKPTAADSQTAQVATAVNAMKGKPIIWPVKLGGTLLAPKVTDSGVDDVLKGGVLDAAKGIAGDKAKAEVDKQLDKNPKAKEAADKLKGLFPAQKK